MKYSVLSPIPIDISDLFPDIMSLFQDMSNLEKVRDYQENQNHNDSSKTTYLEAMKRHYWKRTKANLQVFKAPTTISDIVIERFKWLESIPEKPLVSLQLINGGSILLPHRDENRSCSILISINDNRSFTNFYQEKIQQDEMVPHPDNISLKQSTCFGIGENWFFDNKTIHSVSLEQPTRINLSIGFNDITIKQLCEVAFSYAMV